MDSQLANEAAAAQEAPQCYLVTIEVDYEQPEFIKGFGNQADAEEFRAALEAYQQSKPAWPDDKGPQEEWVRVEKARDVWMDKHPGGRAAIGAERFGIITVPFVPAATAPAGMLDMESAPRDGPHNAVQIFAIPCRQHRHEPTAPACRSDCPCAAGAVKP